MNTTSLLNKARKELANTKAKAALAAKAALTARQSATAAKEKLKQSRKLAKAMKKFARKAEDQAEQAHEVLERAQTRLEKLEKRARKNARKQKVSAMPPVKKQTAAQSQIRSGTAGKVPAKIIRRAAKPKKVASTRPVVGKIVPEKKMPPVLPAEPTGGQAGLPGDAPPLKPDAPAV